MSKVGNKIKAVFRIAESAMKMIEYYKWSQKNEAYDGIHIID